MLPAAMSALRLSYFTYHPINTKTKKILNKKTIIIYVILATPAPSILAGVLPSVVPRTRFAGGS